MIYAKIPLPLITVGGPVKQAWACTLVLLLKLNRSMKLMSHGAKTIKKNTNSTQNKSQTHCAKQYEVMSLLSTDCELSTETCSKNVYSLGP